MCMCTVYIVLYLLPTTVCPVLSCRRSIGTFSSPPPRAPVFSFPSARGQLPLGFLWLLRPSTTPSLLGRWQALHAGLASCVLRAERSTITTKQTGERFRRRLGPPGTSLPPPPPSPMPARERTVPDRLFLSFIWPAGWGLQGRNPSIFP